MRGHFEPRGVLTTASFHPLRTLQEDRHYKAPESGPISPDPFIGSCLYLFSRATSCRDSLFAVRRGPPACTAGRPYTFLFGRGFPSGWVPGDPMMARECCKRSRSTPFRRWLAQSSSALGQDAAAARGKKPKGSAVSFQGSKSGKMCPAPGSLEPVMSGSGQATTPGA